MVEPRPYVATSSGWLHGTLWLVRRLRALQAQQKQPANGNSAQIASALPGPSFRQLSRISSAIQPQGGPDIASIRSDGAAPRPHNPSEQPSSPDHASHWQMQEVGQAPTGSVQIAQALPSSLLFDLPYTTFARPPIFPRQLTPLEELPKGSSGGPGAGKPFPRSFREQEPPQCTYCGRPTTHEPGPDKLQGDHVIPRAQGGNNDRTNRVPSCRTCNLQKRDRTPEQWYLWLQGKGA